MAAISTYILVLNCGSSSIKFAIIEPITGETPLKGLAENLFTDNGRISYAEDGEKDDCEHVLRRARAGCVPGPRA